MKKKYSKLFDSKNRAMSDIISTMLLVAITIVGGVTAFALFNSIEITQLGGDPEFESGAITNRAVKLMGFDTRDGANLAGIAVIDNSVPASASALTGGEFIVLRVRNLNFDDVIIDIVNVNEEPHVLDLDGHTVLTSVTTPDEGEFNIVPLNSLTFLAPAIIPGGQDATIIISLEDDLADIGLTESIRILIGSPNFDSLQFLIPAGGIS